MTVSGKVVRRGVGGGRTCHGVVAGFVLVVLGGCAGQREGAPVQGAPISWKSCGERQFSGWFAESHTSPELQCAYIEVPLAYDGSLRGKTLRLALTRLPALGERRGSVLLVSGGPGIPGIGLPLQVPIDGPSRALHESFDIVGYDPRGVGQSSPAIRCDAGHGSGFEGDRAIALARMRKPLDEDEVQVRDHVLDCVERSGLDLLAHVGSREAAEDLDSLRTALGEPRLTAVAYSYGTKVAALYAERHPDKVRAMVLDGVVDLSETSPMVQMAQGRGFQQAFEAFATYCAKTGACPLAAEPAQAARDYQALLRRVDAEAIALTNGKTLSGDDVIQATSWGLLWPEQWPQLANALANLHRGDATAVASMLGEQTGYDDALMAISCADDAEIDANRAARLRVIRKIGEASPFSFYDAAAFGSLDQCDFWPFAGSSQAHVPQVASALPPLLFVAQRRDPTTPYANAQRMAGYFNANLLTRDGDGHTVALAGLDACVDAAVSDYLLQPDRQRGDSQCVPPAP
ncbi:alpha/beta fold hydrolase [Pseudomonas sp. PDNC002]|uniref:alpha/beta hydrolase n=1 Tax=Pseudomonas sp. PDNC002 TaxID=2811422 RepID=UPI0019669F2B|nr:alpha/beta hydrolase [Pseudomonas sp. PDNC002]QRY79779.1 alpha/beta fold hydrolase [Pseudomonas sp. PDNC002]